MPRSTLAHGARSPSSSRRSMASWRARARAIAQRPVEPAPQQAPAHRRGGLVEHAEQRVLVAPGQAAVQLEVAARGRVHDQRLVARLGGQPRRCGRALRCVSSTYCSRQPAACTASGSSAQPKPARSATPNCRHSRRWRRRGRSATAGGSSGRQLAHEGRQAASSSTSSSASCRRSSSAASASGPRAARRGSARRPDPARRGRCPRARVHAAQQHLAPLLEQALVGDGAGRDDAHHLPLDRSLRGGRVADLLADRDRLALAHQLGEVALDAVHRHARPSGSAGPRSGRASSG
jgi:hypothetical protein